MLDIALKNILRHKTRSFLTISGIALGIGLMLALGAVGKGLSMQIEQQFASRVAYITVSASDRSEGISQETIDGIKNLPGVESAIPIGTYTVRRTVRGGFGGGFPGGFGGGIAFTLQGPGGRRFTDLTFTGIKPEDLESIIGDQITAEEGRLLEESDSEKEVVLLGHAAAENQNLNVGEEIEYQHKDRNTSTTETYYFEVIGILEETGDSTIDNSIYVPLDTMQEIEDQDTIQDMRVKATDVNLVEDITQQITDYYDDVRAFSVVTIIRQLQSSLSQIQLAVYGIAGISLIVGGLSIMNTMIMSVMERRREIGIMKAIGATTTTILTQVLQESAIMSLLGGILGLSLGYISVYIIPKISSFTPILTPDLMTIGVGFALILGISAGIYPAWNASRLDPIEVLRYE